MSEPFATLAKIEDGRDEAQGVIENTDSIGNSTRVELRDVRGRTVDSDEALTPERREFADDQSIEIPSSSSQDSECLCNHGLFCRLTDMCWSLLGSSSHECGGLETIIGRLQQDVLSLQDVFGLLTYIGLSISTLSALDATLRLSARRRRKTYSKSTFRGRLQGHRRHVVVVKATHSDQAISLATMHLYSFDLRRSIQLRTYRAVRRQWVYSCHPSMTSLYTVDSHPPWPLFGELM